MPWLSRNLQPSSIPLSANETCNEKMTAIYQMRRDKDMSREAPGGGVGEGQGCVPTGEARGGVVSRGLSWLGLQ